MSPSAERVQCPFCFGSLRVKEDGVMYSHDWGRPGVLKRCPGAGKTREAAKLAKALGERMAGESGQPDEVSPEDIF